MYRKMFAGFLCCVILCLINRDYLLIDKVKFCINEASAARITDVTERVEDLGIPFSVKGYARNIWDMQVYSNKIYLGHGNSQNYGPNAYEGPIPIYCYDILRQTFVKEYVTSEDQLSNYKIIDGQLYLPGLDSRESWDYGNFYKLSEGSWEKYRNIPKAIHVYDMAIANGILYTVTGSDDDNVLYRSGNYGKTWSPITLNTDPPYWPLSNRMYTLINFRNKVYAIDVVFLASGDSYRNKAVVIDGTKVSTIKIYRDKILPETQIPYKYYRLDRATSAIGKMAYISQKYDYNNSWISEALYFSEDINRAEKAVFPESGAIPTDMAVRDKFLYVLAYIKISETVYTNIVYKTENYKGWTEVLRFDFDTFARSFEEAYGSFYFGMGCYTERIPDSVGKILKVVPNNFK